MPQKKRSKLNTQKGIRASGTKTSAHPDNRKDRLQDEVPPPPENAENIARQEEIDVLPAKVARKSSQIVIDVETHQVTSDHVSSNVELEQTGKPVVRPHHDVRSLNEDQRSQPQAHFVINPANVQLSSDDTDDDDDDDSRHRLSQVNKKQPNYNFRLHSEKTRLNPPHLMPEVIVLNPANVQCLSSDDEDMTTTWRDYCQSVARHTRQLQDDQREKRLNDTDAVPDRCDDSDRVISEPGHMDVRGRVDHFIKTNNNKDPLDIIEIISTPQTVVSSNNAIEDDNVVVVVAEDIVLSPNNIAQFESNFDEDVNVIVNENNPQVQQVDMIDYDDMLAEVERARNRAAQVQTYLQASIRFNIEPHNSGMMNRVCRHCRARYFPTETTARGEYNKCCAGGKVRLPPLREHPNVLQLLFNGQHVLSREFKQKILYYNNCFQFVSIQANLRDIPGRGPYVYAIQGKIYHHYSDINVERPVQSYGPMYFLDPEQAIEQRLNNARHHEMNPQIMQLLTELLQQVNPFAQQYRHMHDVYEEERRNMAEDNIRIPRVFLELVGQHRNRANRQHDLPEVDEVAIVANYDENNPPNPRMRVFLTDRDSGLRILDQTSEFCDPLAFPLLFPQGDLGWNMNIPLIRQQNGDRERRERERVTLCQFYAYRLSYRQTDAFQIFEHGDKLMQQFIVTAYLKIEANRINYFVQNQNLLRADEYYGLADYVHNRAAADNVPFGRMVILPSSFTTGPRNQMQRFQDAMAVVAQTGYPSLFITMTCNPNWPEIRDNLPVGEVANNHPLLIDRVFKTKLDQLMKDLTKHHVMGVCIAYLHVIEFQKRGLPHAHILITLRNEDKPVDDIRIDQIISAELPDPVVERDLYDLVGRHMIHGPCGRFDPTGVCMAEGKCTKHFPKYWYNNTTIRNGFVDYRRRNDGRSIEMRRNNRVHVVTNQYVVPYNPYLLLKYRTHINVEACTSVNTVKYLYKYFFKGPDQALLRIVENRDNPDEPVEMRYDEIRSFLNGRYMTPHEAGWHILQMPMHLNSHHVTRLAIHLPGRQRIVFREGGEEVALDRAGNTQLLAWFQLNQIDAEAPQYLYSEIPMHYVWNKNNRKQWTPRQRMFGQCVSRMYNIPIPNGELFYLRVLLLYVRGATSFDDLLTVDGQLCGTFQEACRRRNLLAEDREWFRCLTEAGERDMPGQIRRLFAYILVFCQVSDPRQLYAHFREHFIQDYRRRGLEEREAEIRALQKIQFILTVNGRRLSNFGLEDPPDYQPDLVQDPIDVLQEREIGNEMFERLNADQRNVFDVVMTAVEDADEPRRLFFVTGAAGTGKTYLYNTLISVINGRRENVIAVAWTGIAAALLKHGRTVHSRFRLPVPIVEDSTSSLTPQSQEAAFIRDAKLIIWDEVTMATRASFDLVDRALKDVCRNDRPFGGKCVIIGGDFKQCLPVVPNGDRTTIVANSIKYGNLWVLFENIELNTNMRVEPDEREFIAWLRLLGNGQLPVVDLGNNRNRRYPDLIQIPQQCVVDTLEELIDKIFGRQIVPGQVPNKAILTPLNVDCHRINRLIVDTIDNPERTYLSIDSIVTDNENEAADYPIEFLNTLTPNGFAQHELRLKEGAIVMLLKNLNVRANLCNGTRLSVRRLAEHYIEAEIISFDGHLSGDTVFLPRIDFVSTETNLPFTMRRRQFPIRLSYAMTINKAQGQTFDAVGIFLPNPVFTHGQLYVAFSRARTIDGVAVCIRHSGRQGVSVIDNNAITYTANTVYTEVLD